ncbi:Hypothetical protein NTJ_10990 [Nesidiocoris tenuis]|uniref:Protein CIP2A n=1 Tax=Nesidiocoris tenuis TaxID=355587 RepID=A0ABN7B4R8_9HEMI|nr:Hypothetical protein NTJ_10990 [Nesidiocoris tenuis]
MENIKLFNVSAKHFLATRKTEYERQIERTLQVLANSSDSSIFDSDLQDTTHFYVNLHEIMSTLDRPSDVAWTAVNILHKACKNPTARRNLSEVYHFMPILTRLLSSDPSPDKEVILLQLMEELTYGISIPWQLAYLPTLMSTLTKYIAPDMDKERVNLSLTILINLCYENQPAVHALMRTIDIKRFLKTALALHSNMACSEIQVIKLLIILKEYTIGLPVPDEGTFFKSVVSTLQQAISTGNSCLMRQTVSFYKHLIRKRGFEKCIDDKAEIQQLLSSLPPMNRCNRDCMDALFDYLSESIDHQSVGSLHSNYLSLAIQWITEEKRSISALNLVSKILVHVANSNDQENGGSSMIALLDDNVAEIIKLLDVECGVQSEDSYLELTAVLQLVSKMVKVSKLTSKVSSMLNPTVFRNLFKNLCGQELQSKNLNQEAVYTCYIQAIALLQQLSDMEARWFVLYTELLQQRQVQYILAVALYIGDEQMKTRVLELTTTRGYSVQCLGALASCMAEINKLLIFSPMGKLDTQPKTADVLIPMDVSPNLTPNLEKRVDALLDKVARDYLKKSDTSVSSVIELYQYKLAAVDKTVRTVQHSLEAADRLTTSLQHNAALTKTEVARLHQTLHCAQQRCETLAEENAKLSERIGEIEERTSDLHKKHSEALQTLKSKTRIIAEMTTQLDEQKNKIATLEDEMKSSILNLEEQLDSTSKSLKSCQDELAQKKKELESESEKLAKLKEEYMNQAVELSKLEKAKAETDAEADELNKQLQIISQLASKRKDASFRK